MRRGRRCAGSGSVHWLLAAALLAAPTGCGSPGPGERTGGALLLDADEVARVLRLAPRPAPPPDPTNRVADDPRAAALGQRLFFDAGLSADGQTSCATCHDPQRAFTDGLPVAEALATGHRNTPTVLDTAHNRWFFWDGRADSAWAQALHPIEDPREMGGDRVAVLHHLADTPELGNAYAALFGLLPDRRHLPRSARPAPGGPQDADERDHAWRDLPEPVRRDVDRVFTNVGKALAAYQRRLPGGPSPFDAFADALRHGRRDAGDRLSASAQRGLRIFLGSEGGGCTRCHFGPRLTDGEFHNTGVPPAGPGPPRDGGRYEGARLVAADPFNAAGRHSDDRKGARARSVTTLRQTPESWGAFKTPSLRDVARTPPYMHAGQLPDLHAVVRFYSTLEGAVTGSHHAESVLQPLGLTEGQIDDLVAFLEALTGSDPPAELLAPPP